MKKNNITYAALMIIFLSGIVYAQEMGKCNGMKESNMKNNAGMMESDFSAKKSMMQNNLIKAKECVDMAQTTQDLNNCRMGMMQNKQNMMNMNGGMMQDKQDMMQQKQEMMQQKQNMMNMNGGMMQDKQDMMQQNKINKIKECVNAATTLQEIQNCKAGMMQ